MYLWNRRIGVRKVTAEFETLDYGAEGCTRTTIVHGSPLVNLLCEPWSTQTPWTQMNVRVSWGTRHTVTNRVGKVYVFYFLFH
jgi:hypothetical protein